jgi:multiple sugar transport system permease protein
VSVFEELRSVRSSKTTGKRDNKAAFFFLLPWLVGLVLITAGPMVASLWISFTNYNLIQAPHFTGFDNYVRMFQDPRLLNSLRVTFEYVFISVPIQLVIALAAALLLDKGMRALPFYRSVFYLPSLLGSSVAVAILWRQIFGQGGLVNQVLGMVGLHNMPGWISDPQFALGTIILLNIWTFGAPMIIFLAGLRQIPAELYEAAAIDGATGWKSFLRVTLPLARPGIAIAMVQAVIATLNVFDQPYVLNGAASTGASVTEQTYFISFQNLDFGEGYALSLLITVATVVISLAVVRLVYKPVEF